jgi:hypothetical protein
VGILLYDDFIYNLEYLIAADTLNLQSHVNISKLHLLELFISQSLACGAPSSTGSLASCPDQDQNPYQAGNLNPSDSSSLRH